MQALSKRARLEWREIIFVIRQADSHSVQWADTSSLEAIDVWHSEWLIPGFSKHLTEVIPRYSLSGIRGTKWMANFPPRHLQRCKTPYVQGLGEVGCVRWQSTEDNLFFCCHSDGFRTIVCRVAIKEEDNGTHAWNRMQKVLKPFTEDFSGDPAITGEPVDGSRHLSLCHGIIQCHPVENYHGRDGIPHYTCRLAL